ncbi:uncharacterized protein VP01_8082g1, partial [Puccinia sorghi]
LSFGQLLQPDNINFFYKLIDLDDADYLFDFDVLGWAETPNLDCIADVSCPTNPSPMDRGNLTRLCTSNDPIGCSVAEPNSTLAPPQCEFVSSSLVTFSAGHLLFVKSGQMQKLSMQSAGGPADQDYTTIMNSSLSPALQRSNPKMSKYSIRVKKLERGQRYSREDHWTDSRGFGKRRGRTNDFIC